MQQRHFSSLLVPLKSILQCTKFIFDQGLASKSTQEAQDAPPVKTPY